MEKTGRAGRWGQVGWSREEKGGEVGEFRRVEWEQAELEVEGGGRQGRMGWMGM